MDASLAASARKIASYAFHDSQIVNQIVESLAARQPPKSERSLVCTHLSLTHTLKQAMIWSAAFSSNSPGFLCPSEARYASAWREGGREREASLP